MNTPVHATLSVAATVAVITAVVTLLLHPIEIGFAENDLYVLQAEQLLRGEPYLDGFHPALYVQLTALVALPLGDAFLAARLLSAVANGLLAAATFALALRLAGPPAAWCAAAAVTTCPAVLVQALQASSDTLATALMVTTCAAAMRAAATRTLLDAVVAGLCFGLAMATRPVAVVCAFALLLPLAVPALTRRRRLALLGASVAGAVAGHLPHALAAWSQLGSPFADHSWRNTLLKVSGFDGSLLHDPPYATPWAFLRAHAGEVLSQGLADLRATLGSGLGKVLGSLVWTPAALALAAVVVVAFALLTVRRRLPGLALGLVFTAYLVLVCVTFVPNERLLLPLIPLAFVALAASLRDKTRWLAAAFVLALCVAVASNLRALPGWLRDFADAHPTAEVAVVRQLAKDGTPAPIGSTYASMRRHVAARVVGIWMPARTSLRTAADAHAHLQRIAREDGGTVFIVGRRTGEHLWRLLHGAAPPHGVTVSADTDDFVIVRLER